jgi:hypothetical protein
VINPDLGQDRGEQGDTWKYGTDEKENKIITIEYEDRINWG